MADEWWVWPTGYCREGERCNCGGDLPAVREGCGAFIKGPHELTTLRAEVERLRAENERLRHGHWIADDGLKTAPLERPLIVCTEVHNHGGETWWDKHIIILDYETGDVTNDTHQGWDREDYTHWMLVPDDPDQPAPQEPKP